MHSVKKGVELQFSTNSFALWRHRRMLRARRPLAARVVGYCCSTYPYVFQLLLRHQMNTKTYNFVR